MTLIVSILMLSVKFYCMKVDQRKEEKGGEKRSTQLWRPRNHENLHSNQSLTCVFLSPCFFHLAILVSVLGRMSSVYAEIIVILRTRKSQPGYELLIYFTLPTFIILN